MANFCNSSSVSVSQCLKEYGILFSTSKENGSLWLVVSSRDVPFLKKYPEDAYGTFQTVVEKQLSTKLVEGYALAVSPPSQRGGYFTMPRQTEDFSGTSRERMHKLIKSSSDALRNREELRDLVKGESPQSADCDFWELSTDVDPWMAFLTKKYTSGTAVVVDNKTYYHKDKSTASYHAIPSLVADILKMVADSELKEDQGKSDTAARPSCKNPVGTSQKEMWGDEVDRVYKGVQIMSDGVSIAVPERTYQQVFPKSSRAAKNAWLTATVPTKDLVKSLRGDHMHHSLEVKQALKTIRDELKEKNVQGLARKMPKTRMSVPEYVKHTKRVLKAEGLNELYAMAHLMRFHGQLVVDKERFTIEWKD